MFVALDRNLHAGQFAESISPWEITIDEVSHEAADSRAFWSVLPDKDIHADLLDESLDILSIALCCTLNKTFSIEDVEREARLFTNDEMRYFAQARVAQAAAFKVDRAILQQFTQECADQNLYFNSLLAAENYLVQFWIPQQNKRSAASSRLPWQ